MRRLERIKEVSVYENEFGTLFDDSVLTPAGHIGQYLRWRWTKPGVLVLPVKNEEIGLLKMYRYPIGKWSLEVPRGAIEVGEKIEDAALRELREETGLIADQCRVLGEVVADTGLLETPVKLVLATVNQSMTVPKTEPMELVDPEVIWLKLDELTGFIRTGKIICALTIAGIMMYQANREEK